MLTERIDPWRLKIPRQDKMLVDAIIYCTQAMSIGDGALRQLADTACLPSVRYTFATPDIHHGFGAPIGAVVALKDYICPAAVGYDVNCGMRLLTTTMQADSAPIKQIAHEIGRTVPLGEGKSGKLRLTSGQLRQVLERGVKGLFELKPIGGEHFARWDEDTFRADYAAIEDEGSMSASSSFLSEKTVARGLDQLGTLGGGNHFIELQKVEMIDDKAVARAFGIEEGALVVMIHSGSRGLGHQVGEEYMKHAYNSNPDISPNKQLGVFALDSNDGNRYIDAMRCAANFAFANRQVMANLVRNVFAEITKDSLLKTIYDVAHNIAKKETHGATKLWVHRKGATRAFPPSMMEHEPYSTYGQPVLIPGSMGTSSYLLVGDKRAAESLYSVNHGAGRVMSRTAAAGRKQGGSMKGGAITDAEFHRSMDGIHLICADPRSIKEEAPQAYKDIDLVIHAVTGAGLAKVIARMRPLAVLKG